MALVKSVSEKMKGFSRKETQDYYKNIMEQAWAQVEAAKTPEIKGQAIDQNLEWTMLDHDYNNRSQRVFTGPIFLPIWWGGYDPMYRSAPMTTGAAPASLPSGGVRSTSLPGSTFAASVVGGVQNFSSKVIGNLNSFTSGVSNVTNPPPPPSTRQLSRRRWRSLRLRLRVCRLRLCLCRWRKIINTPKDYRYETYGYVQA